MTSFESIPKGATNDIEPSNDKSALNGNDIHNDKSPTTPKSNNGGNILRFIEESLTLQPSLKSITHRNTDSCLYDETIQPSMENISYNIEKHFRQQKMYIYWNSFRFILIGGLVLLANIIQENELTQWTHEDDGFACCNCFYYAKHNTTNRIDFSKCITSNCCCSNCQSNANDDNNDVCYVNTKHIDISHVDNAPFTKCSINDADCPDNVSFSSSLYGIKIPKYYYVYGFVSIVIAIIYVLYMFIIIRSFESNHSIMSGNVSLFLYNSVVGQICFYCAIKAFQYNRENVSDGFINFNCYTDCLSDILEESLSAINWGIMFYVLLPFLCWLTRCCHRLKRSQYYRSCFETFDYLFLFLSLMFAVGFMALLLVTSYVVAKCRIQAGADRLILMISINILLFGSSIDLLLFEFCRIKLYELVTSIFCYKAINQYSWIHKFGVNANNTDINNQSITATTNNTNLDFIPLK